MISVSAGFDYASLRRTEPSLLGYQANARLSLFSLQTKKNIEYILMYLLKDSLDVDMIRTRLKSEWQNDDCLMTA